MCFDSINTEHFPCKGFQRFQVLKYRNIPTKLLQMDCSKSLYQQGEGDQPKPSPWECALARCYGCPDAPGACLRLMMIRHNKHVLAALLCNQLSQEGLKEWHNSTEVNAPEAASKKLIWMDVLIKLIRATPYFRHLETNLWKIFLPSNLFPFFTHTHTKKRKKKNMAC